MKKILVCICILTLMLNLSACSPYRFEVTENTGRDIFPFIKQMSKCYKKYDFILKLHTKKTEEYDSEWCEYLLKNLVGDKYTIASILQYLNENGGVMYPVYLLTFQLEQCFIVNQIRLKKYLN